MAKQSSKDIFYCGLASLVKENWQTDVQLKAGDSDPGAAIFAHKLVLAARSNVFKKMFEKDDHFKFFYNKGIITISEMNHEELEALVHFIYIPYVSSSKKGLKKHARSLYLAANKYEIPFLRDQCRKELISSLNLANVLDVLNLAQIPFDDDLNNAAFDYITENINTIANSDELKQFAVSNSDLTVEILKASLKRSI